MKAAALWLTVFLAWPATPALAVDYPDVNEGLWQRHWTTVKDPGEKKSDATQSVCRSRALSRQSFEEAHKIPGCTYVKEALLGSMYTAEIRCELSTIRLVTHSTALIKDTAVHTESVTTYEPAMSGVATESDTVDEKFLGPCPAGMKPGDRMTAEGTIQHAQP